ncbi:MAG: CHAT domain-containing protein [Planctomycetes bacterium]|nr:CHAT domain-containing protein [Planctomycetota bacterium]
MTKRENGNADAIGALEASLKLFDDGRAVDAAARLAQALRLLNNPGVDSARAVELLRMFGDAAARAGDHEIAATARGAAFGILWKQDGIDNNDPDRIIQLNRARLDFAWSSSLAGDPVAAERVLREEILFLDSRERRPLDLIDATRARLGMALAEQRRAAEALPILEDAVAGLRHAASSGSLPSGSLDLAFAENALGAVFDFEGHIDKAETHFRAALEYYDKAAAIDRNHNERTRLGFLHNISLALRRRGETREAARIAETVYEQYKKIAPPGNASRAWAGMNLSLARCESGDQDGARAVLSEVYPAILGMPLAGGREAYRLKLHLACNLAEAGNLELSERCIDEVSREAAGIYQTNDPEFALLQQIRGSILRRRGRIGQALSLLEPLLPPASAPAAPFLQLLREAGACYYDSGNLNKARAAQAAALSALERALPRDHPEVARARRELCATLSALEAWPDLTIQLQSLASGLRARFAHAALTSSREAECLARAAGADLSALLTLDFARPAVHLLSEDIFELIETRRLLGAFGDPRGSTPSADPQIRQLRERIASARARLSTAGVRLQDPMAPPLDADEILRITSERDRAESELRERLARAQPPPPEMDYKHLAAALEPDAALISYHRYDANRAGVSEGRIVAHVARAGNALARVDLGPRDAVDRAIADWLEALHSGDSNGPERGLGALRPHESSPAAVEKSKLYDTGGRLREMLLDPLLGALGDARTIHILPDGAIHGVPFDILPIREGLIGDRARIVYETSVARLLKTRARVRGTRAGIVGAGNIDFGACGKPPRFEALPGTLREIETIVDLYKNAHKKDGVGGDVILSGANVTKNALREAAASARIIHIATHAYSRTEPEAPVETGVLPRENERLMLQFSPMALCGLALSQANASPQGVVTAEELAFFPLAGVELAVLSACETGAGRAGAGPSVASLRAALHAAGVDASITSLWRVPDAISCEFMAYVYLSLMQSAPLSEALWNAKLRLRGRGVPARFWGAWVGTGETRFEFPTSK